ncbi:hypothetical protein GOV12_01590 [Candidatus Pacearchaeota archaeon]|nr:hypothetical protein [Candidatus Pacearchaeota archaeon]
MNICTLEDALNDFSKSVDRLLNDPNYENACEARVASSLAFGDIYSVYQAEGGLKPESYEQFVIDLSDCLTGFGLVDRVEGNESMDKLVWIVEFNKDLVLGLKKGIKDYVSRRIIQETVRSVGVANFKV